MKNILLKNSTLKRGLKGSSSTNFSLGTGRNRLKSGLKMSGTKKGFGLLEVLISAVIIIMILAALVFIGRAALSNNEYLSERAQAVYLAQEGLEIARQIRDTSWIDGENITKWNSLVHFPSIEPPVNNRPYLLEVFNAPFLLYEYGLIECDPTTCDSITIDGVIFVRKITVNTVNAPLLPNSTGTDLTPYALKVTSKIEWKFSGVDKTVEASEILTNWRPDF